MCRAGWGGSAQGRAAFEHEIGTLSECGPAPRRFAGMRGGWGTVYLTFPVPSGEGVWTVTVTVLGESGTVTSDCPWRPAFGMGQSLVTVPERSTGPPRRLRGTSPRGERGEGSRRHGTEFRGRRTSSSGLGRSPRRPRTAPSPFAAHDCVAIALYQGAWRRHNRGALGFQAIWLRRAEYGEPRRAEFARDNRASRRRRGPASGSVA